MLVFHASLRCFHQQFTRTAKILRVDSLPERFSGWRTLPRVKAKNVEHFLGPVQGLESDGAPSPTSCVAQPLPFRQISLTSPQCFFGALSLGDVGQHGKGACETMLG